MSRLRILLLLYYFALFPNKHSMLVISQPYSTYAPAYPSVSWINSLSSPYSISFPGSTKVNIILLTSASHNSAFGCGFFCNGDCHSYIFAVFLLYMNGSGIHGIDLDFDPVVVWSANRNNPVKINATMKLTTSGLLLKDSDTTTIWHTGDRKSVAGLSLTEMGNLLLADTNNVTLWQSFDHPTDSLLYGQKLVAGGKGLVSSTTENDSREGFYSLSVTNEGLFAFFNSNPPLVYYQFIYNGTKKNRGTSYVTYENQTLVFYSPFSSTSKPDKKILFTDNFLESESGSVGRLYIQLTSDGWLEARQYKIKEGLGKNSVSKSWYPDILGIDYCGRPMVCGKYGVCSSSFKCDCPEIANGTSYFKRTNVKVAKEGCYAITPLSCGVSQYHTFMELKDTTYFTFKADLEDVDSERCKQACLKNCSCKAVIFRYDLNPSKGKCYLPTEVLSLMTLNKNSTGYSSTTYLKVQNTVPRKMKKKKSIPLAVSFGLGAFVFGLFSIATLAVLFHKKKDNDYDDDDEENNFDDQVPGMPKRFSYEDLKAMTHNFDKKLGEGGFGTVFEGVLTDGSTKIAVKCLDGFGRIKKSFLTEVATIGSIHHVNLVRMVGFCAEKSHRLLVYEYMSNGSLDKWIFHKTYDFLLSWKQRKKMMLDIAKGLNYLHEDCMHKILHLDIKPENILLDEDFNGKVSDFGLCKLIDRDQSQVVTTMRGTPGYLAPEWISSTITEKVDVYSFGIVMMEILCGRRNIDRSQPDEAMHLLPLFKKKYELNQISGLIDKCCEDMQSNEEEVLKMMKAAAWCLQSDYAKRPSMSMVVKVLEEVTDIDYKLGLDNNFFNATFPDREDNFVSVTNASLVGPSLLSGGR